MHWRRRRQREEDLERELRSHLELDAEDREEDGLSPEQAHYAAQRAFGNTTSTKEAVREMWMWTAIEQIWRDVRYAGRALRKDGRFTIAAIVSLSLGIGPTTAIFTVVNGVLLRPLAYPDAARLFSVQESHEEELERELRSDLELEIAEQQANGLPEEEARYAAQRAAWRTTRVDLSPACVPSRRAARVDPMVALRYD